VAEPTDNRGKQIGQSEAASTTGEHLLLKSSDSPPPQNTAQIHKEKKNNLFSPVQKKWNYFSTHETISKQQERRTGESGALIEEPTSAQSQKVTEKRGQAQASGLTGEKVRGADSLF
jgi:hypothetical protein